MESTVTDKQPGMTLGWVAAFAWAIDDHILSVQRRNGIEHSLRLSRDCLDALCGATIALDKQGRIVFANEAAHGLLGRTEGMLMGRYYGELFAAGRELDNHVFSHARQASIDATFANSTSKHRLIIVHAEDVSFHTVICIDSNLSSNASNVRAKTRPIIVRSVKNQLKDLELRVGHRRNILICGERGCGKRTLARLAANSIGTPAPELDCAQTPPELADRTLFGYWDHLQPDLRVRGVVESAGDGYVIVEDIDLLPIATQASLARALRNHVFRRVGESIMTSTEVRIIATTKQDLVALAKQGQFDNDLLTELLWTAPVEIAPLRTWGNDIEELADHLAHGLGGQCGHAHTQLAKDAQKLITAFSWPGNIAQLKNALTFALISSANGTITRDDFPKDIVSEAESRTPNALHATLREIEELAIRQAVERCSSLSKAAEELGIARTTLYRKMREYGIE